MLKTCPRCSTSKPVKDFGKNKRNPDGLASWCRSCKTKNDRAWYAANKAEVSLRSRATYPERKATIALTHRRYYLEHKDEIIARQNVNDRKRRRHDHAFRLRQNLRTRLRHALHGETKSEKTTVLLGCNTADLVAHLEAGFLPGMTWENYGVRGWHVDHIEPLSAFDLSVPEQQGRAFHYTNLQPLWAGDNIRKGGAK